jgi:hypothetical protein
MAIWPILYPFDIFFDYLVYFSRYGMLYKEKSGNPAFNVLPKELQRRQHYRRKSFYKSVKLSDLKLPQSRQKTDTGLPDFFW